MRDANWKIWALALLIAVGVSFELMKRFPGSDLTQWVGVVTKSRPPQPYSVRVKPGANAQPRPSVRPSGQQPAKPPTIAADTDRANRELLEKLAAGAMPGKLTFSEEKGGEGKKKLEECDDANPKLDPATGKKLPCKKKKKKKDEAKEEIAKSPAPPVEEIKDDVDSTTSEAVSSGEIPQPLSNKPDAPFDSLEEWARRLLNYPDAQETKRFIDHYQRNLVTAEVFYKITAMMIDDPREKMKQLGIMCAGLNPSLLSFQLLAHLMKAERSGSPPRRDAESYLNRYSDLNNLGILERVLRAGGNDYAVELATQKVDASATRYLTLSSSGPKAGASQAALVRRNAGHFQRFVPLLQNLAASGNGSIKAQASRSLADLQRLLADANPNAAGPGSVTASN